MGIFHSIKKSRRVSSDIDEKIEYLNRELVKTGLHEMMTTSNMYQQGTEVPNQDSVDFQGLSLNGFALGLSAEDGNHIGGAILDNTGVALSPPHPVTGARNSAVHIRNGTGDSIPLRPGKTTIRGDGNNAPTYKMGGAVWFFHPASDRWCNCEFFTAPGAESGAMGFWDTNNAGFWFHNTTGVHPCGDILSLLSGINFGANGNIGPDKTIVLTQNRLDDPDFLPINIDGLSTQGFNYLKGKATGTNVASGVNYDVYNYLLKNVNDNRAAGWYEENPTLPHTSNPYIPPRVAPYIPLASNPNNQLPDGTEIAGYGLLPDGTHGFSKLGDTNRGHDGTLYKLVPRKGYGYNQWVPVKKA